MVTTHFKDSLHVAELFREDGRTISGVITLDPSGVFDSNWEPCPGALKGEVVYHKKSNIEPRNDTPKVAGGDTYCSGYHKTVWAKKNRPGFTGQNS
ncbi:MAG: hypothetical protein KBD29_02960 [Candidatus Magasanikbacteria bacterium]|nr:hypothetical protein [Candidatus Magasanikbacteria bacterium]